MVAVVRPHKLVPSDDGLYGRRPTIPHPTPSIFHRGLQRHGSSRLPDAEGGTPWRQRFERNPIPRPAGDARHR